MRMKRKLPAIILLLALLLLAGCSGKQEEKSTKSPDELYPRLLGEVRKTDSYTENELYIWNKETERKVYCREVIPSTYAEGQKLPTIVYVHGYNGSADALSSEAYALAKDGIAGFTFECCGGNKVTPKSDGKEICPSHYTSRVSDFEAVLAYVKTLSYVDTAQIFLYGQSYGGVVSMAAAPNHNADLAGLILESSGVSQDGGLILQEGNGTVEKYLVPADWKGFVKQFSGNVLICNSEGDKTITPDVGEFTASLYEAREGSSAQVRFVLCPDGDHAFNSFSEEGKTMTLDAMREMVKGK